jgi:P-type E1-E2 ATPase
MLITLVLLGKTLERRAKHRVLEDLELFFSLKPSKVRICSKQFPDGRFVSAEQFATGDIFQVNETEIVPADGKILAGSGSVDESSLTGEPLPITKKPGETMRSGVKILQGTFQIRAEKVGEASTLGQMIDIIEKTLLSKTPLEGKTDVILQWFVPVIFVWPHRRACDRSVRFTGGDGHGHILSVCTGYCHSPGACRRNIDCGQKGNFSARF